MDWYKILYYTILYGSYVLYGLLLLAILGGLPNMNLSDKIPEYLTVLQNGLKYYVCFFLIARFNPFMRSKGEDFTDFDADVVFSSAIFLLLTTSFTSIAYTHVMEQIKNPLRNPFNEFKFNKDYVMKSIQDIKIF